MSLYMLLHLLTDYNFNGLITGCANSKILPNQSIKHSYETMPHFDIVICSPLSRCKDTVGLIPKECISSLVINEKLIERNVGFLEGMPKDEAAKLYPELFYNRKINVNVDIPNGESIADVMARLQDVVSFLLEIPPQKDVLVCSHNQTLKVLFSMLRNFPITNHYWSNFNFNNGVLVKIDDIVL